MTPVGPIQQQNGPSTAGPEMQFVQRHKRQKLFLFNRTVFEASEFVPVGKQKKLSELSSSGGGVRLLNGALFTPNSSVRKISSPKLVLWKRRTDTALSKTLNDLTGTAEGD